jgi:hypothetical protein
MESYTLIHRQVDDLIYRLHKQVMLGGISYTLEPNVRITTSWAIPIEHYSRDILHSVTEERSK